MSKKIGIFLLVVLVLWAVLLLDATQNRGPYQAAAQPVESTGAPAQTDAPETMPLETAEPADAPPETGSADAPYLAQVEAILNRQTMNRTAVTHLVGTGSGDSRTAALAELASRRKMNPIAAFWVLVSEGVYDWNGERAGLPAYALQEIPAREAVRYAYSDAGARALLTELLTLAGQMDEGLGQAVLGTDGAVEPEQVFLSEEDGCRYAYFARTADRSTQILCFYLRGDEWITDVEFQLLYMTDWADPEEGSGQAVSLAAAAELLMTGTCRAGAQNDDAYEVGGHRAEAERFFFTTEEEQGSLTNYRLRK